MRIQSISLVVVMFLTVFGTAPGDIRAGDFPGRPVSREAAEPDFVVAADGSGDFTTLQAAIDAVPSYSDRATLIFIKRGVYDTEKLIVPADKKNVTLLGESRDETILSYHLYDCTAGKCPQEDAVLWSGDNLLTSATLTILAPGFRAENLTIRNTAGPLGQAQALTIRADRTVFVNCNILGYQDTVYFWKPGARSYFSHCLIAGRTDYIYGDGIAFFDQCEIRSWGGGWITAPSTPQSQSYGFVFSHCTITYALNSPRAGDDGRLFFLGRPWHNYPKVAWLYCDLSEKVDPRGWDQVMNEEEMGSYVATTTDIHLYEYGNTGGGAAMGGRTAWAGLRALTPEEASGYTLLRVLGGSDQWDPAAGGPLVKQYTWAGLGVDDHWLAAANWNPEGIPAAGESATVGGPYTLTASGTFAADLNLKNHPQVTVSGKASVTYLAADRATLRAGGNDTLSGRIHLKDTLVCGISGRLTLAATLTGIHPLVKSGAGVLALTNNNTAFSGPLLIREGTLEAQNEGALGKGPVEVFAGATLRIGHSGAFYAKARLTLAGGSFLELDGDLTTSEFYLGGILQAPGEYTAATHPDVLSGSGKVIVGRPPQFQFTGSVSAAWDQPGNYAPALLPLAGETILCEREMETTSTPLAAEVIFRNGGALRLRGNHQATGILHLEEGTVIKYNTGGTGMTLTAPLSVEGNISLVMESDNAAGSTMTLAGPITGNGTVTAINNGKNNKPNTGKVLLTGLNSGFSGMWDVTRLGSRYPGDDRYVTHLEGNGALSFGEGKIKAGFKNRVIFSHAGAAGGPLDLSLTGEARVVLQTHVTISEGLLNGHALQAGTYSAQSHPQWFEGAGTLTVGGTTPEPPLLAAFPGAQGHGKYTTGGRGGRVLYVTNLNDDLNPGSLRYALNQSGARIILFKVSGTIQLKSALKITKGDVTIAGQTAPGDGITLRDYPVFVDADNVIIRYLRFRMGDAAQQEGDALGGRFRKNIIVDHCSMSWSTDECVSFYQNENFTLQWCVIAESLRNSVHGKGSHGYGGIWGGRKASFHHNLLAHHDSRNPRLGEVDGDPFALTDLVDLRNNVIYNWVGNSCYGGEGMNANIINCTYKPGPGTTKKERIISIDKELVSGLATYNIWGKYFIEGNLLTASARATADNWTYGVYNQFNSGYGVVSAADKAAMRLSTPLDGGEITTHTAEKAYEKVLAYAGASLVRDTVDKRVIRDVTTGTATFMTGGNGSINGIIDTQEHVGGWPVLNALPAPTDTDNDGMPDAWEDDHNLDRNSPTDAQSTSVDGKYPNLEVYINSLVATITEEQVKEGTTTAASFTPLRREPLKLRYVPGEETLHISHPSDINRVEIWSVTGTRMFDSSPCSKNPSLRVSFLRGGMYLLRVQDADRTMHSGKFIKH